MGETRQQFHFTPEKGWINDPNGLIYVDGVYHLFYQHYPDAAVWGPMHWGHAVSRDLLMWEHLPIALYPAGDEYIFSGSAILDKENASGLGDGNMPPMLLFYTGHNPKTGEQTQRLAYSTDHVAFHKYEGNPIIGNSRSLKKDFRDPKVIPNQVLGGYTMLLAAGDKIEFYHSMNFLDWTYTGRFLPAENGGFGGVCECPDMLCLEVDGPRNIYVLTMSMVIPAGEGSEEGHLMQYFVGEFDGRTFQMTQPFESDQLLDFGKDNYAMVSFANTEDAIMLGWGENWNDARNNKRQEYFGKMTSARRMGLKKCGERYLLTQTPVVPEDIEKTIKIQQNASVSMQNQSVLADSGTDAITIVNSDSCIVIDGDRIKRNLSGTCRLSVFYDRGYLELFADDGLISYSRNL